MRKAPPARSVGGVSSMNGSHATNVRSIHVQRGCAVTRNVADDGSLDAVYGEGGGCTLNLHGGVQAFIIPLRGSLQVTGSSSVCAVRTGDALATEHDLRIKIVGYAHARWVALLGGKQAWLRMLVDMEQARAPGAQLLPARLAASRDLRRHAIALARATGPSLEGAANVVIDCILALQAPLHEAVSRCPGRTHAKRLNVFLRLQRVRNFIRECCDQELDNDALARMANYSPCHFLRTFNHVFRETPHTCLVHERLLRARRLLNSSDLAIAEVALASGFENRSSFSRLFHQRFGTTANEARRQVRVAA